MPFVAGIYVQYLIDNSTRYRWECTCANKGEWRPDRSMAAGEMRTHINRHISESIDREASLLETTRTSTLIRGLRECTCHPPSSCAECRIALDELDRRIPATDQIQVIVFRLGGPVAELVGRHNNMMLDDDYIKASYGAGPYLVVIKQANEHGGWTLLDQRRVDVAEPRRAETNTKGRKKR